MAAMWYTSAAPSAARCTSSPRLMSPRKRRTPSRSRSDARAVSRTSAPTSYPSFTRWRARWPLVKRDRKDELAVLVRHPKAIRRERGADGVAAEHAVRLDAGAEDVGDPARERLRGGRAGGGRVVEHDAAARHPAQPAKGAPPVGRVHEDAEADDIVELGRSRVERMRIPLAELHIDASVSRPPPGDGEHFRGGVHTGDARAASAQRDGGAAGPRSDVEHGAPGERIQKRGQ